MASKCSEEKEPRGLFVILNKLTTREEGSPEDVDQINSVFTNLNFLNLHPPAYHDFMPKDIIEGIRKLIQYPNYNIPRFLFIMTHGHDDGQLEDHTGNFIHINSIVDHFNVIQNPHLKNSFKMILVNACRGSQEPIYYDSPSNDVKERNHANLVVGFSCLENMKSPRQRGGSPFIKVCCDVFDEDFETTPIRFMMDDIVKRLSSFEMNGKFWKLTPEFKHYGPFSKEYEGLPIGLAIDSIDLNQSDPTLPTQRHGFHQHSGIMQPCHSRAINAISVPRSHHEGNIANYWRQSMLQAQNSLSPFQPAIQLPTLERESSVGYLSNVSSMSSSNVSSLSSSLTEDVEPQEIVQGLPLIPYGYSTNTHYGPQSVFELPLFHRIPMDRIPLLGRETIPEEDAEASDEEDDNEVEDEDDDLVIEDIFSGGEDDRNQINPQDNEKEGDDIVPLMDGTPSTYSSENDDDSVVIIEEEESRNNSTHEGAGSLGWIWSPRFSYFPQDWL